MPKTDSRHHMSSLLMRESLLDRDVMRSTEAPVVRMLPHVHAVKIGARSVLEAGSAVVLPLVEEIGSVLKREKLILSTGGGSRTRHLLSIGLDLGMPTGVLAELSAADALGNAHVLGTLLAPHGVVAIPPEILGHLLPLFLASAPGVIFHGVPPYSLWEHPPERGRVPPHRADAGAFLLAEGFGCKSLTFVKDVDGVYSADPNEDSRAERFERVTTSELRERAPRTLPFDRVLLDLLDTARLVTEFRVIDGRQRGALQRALAGESVGTLVQRG